jgi:hypothetical protein
MSIAIAQFQKIADVYSIMDMQTVSETRRQRLAILVKRYGDSLAKLNEALGLDRTDATLSQIRTSAPHSKTGKPRSMGDELARKIEAKLELAVGWMDTPPSFSEIYGEPDLQAQLHMVMEDMSKNELHMALRLLDAIKIKKNGTDGN